MGQTESNTGRRDDEARAEEAAAAAEDRGERKDKVLHARIPPSRDREIKRRARGLGMSVSTVVRNVLLHTFDLVEDIVNDSTNLALSIAGDEAKRDERKGDRHRAAKKASAPRRDEILGWHEAILNLNAVCDRCNAILAKGTRAAIGICDTPGERSIICPDCLAKLSAAGDDDAPT
ncbi:MAG: hypothetical protein E4H03_11425 [Myxococcales bacterium]|nr:MAG: hypothetical protein E4H03_11425 [Myxococcales bacterium]